LGGLAAGREIPLLASDAVLIKQQCYLVRAVSPELRREVPEVSSFNSANRSVVGMWPEYEDFRSLKVAEGKLITQEDEDQGRRVVVLGYAARQQLFSGQSAVGTTIQINSLPYTVVGVLEKKKQNSNYSGPDNDNLYAPFSALMRDMPAAQDDRKRPLQHGWINDIVFEVANPDDHEAAVRQVRETLGRVHHFEATDKDALFIWDTMDGAKMVQKIFTVITIFFAVVAIMTLCLGGIGVMNIMLVSVSERTREIGVRKAIGATRGDILRQFFAESAILTLFSGVVGLSVGLGLCLVMAIIPLPDFVPHPIISSLALVASLLTLSLVTVTAGMYPAQRAAEMEPIESLRYE
jgi:putative ABC transport system permease protein